MHLLKYIWICCALFFCCSLSLFGQHAFTQYERNHIRIQTPGLFDGKSRLEIHWNCWLTAEVVFRYLEQK